jgi:hypothetical protein
MVPLVIVYRLRYVFTVLFIIALIPVSIMLAIVGVPTLLYLAHRKNLTLTEWILGDTPLHMYDDWQ